MESISHLSYVFCIFSIAISTALTGNISTDYRPVAYINGRKVNFTLFHQNECPPKKSNQEFPVKNITFHHFNSAMAGKTQNFINFTYQHTNPKTQILGHVIHQQGNKSNHVCNLILFPHNVNKIHKNNLFQINFLPTNLTNVSAISITSSPTLSRPKRRKSTLGFSYNKNKTLLQVDIPTDFDPPAYAVTVYKNASHDCTSGQIEKRFSFQRDEDPMPRHIYIDLQPQEGEFCIHITNNLKSEKFYLTARTEIPLPDCVYNGAIKDWNVSIDPKTNPDNFSLQVVLQLISQQNYTCLKKFETQLCTPDTNCEQARSCNRTTYAYQPNIKINFTNLEYGNYCVHVLPLCDACFGENLTRYSKIITLAPLPSVKSVGTTFTTKQNSGIELSIILSVVASVIVLISVVLSLVFHYYLKKRLVGYEPGSDFSNLDVGDIIRKVREKAKVKSRKVLLVSVALDPNLRTAVEKFTQVLRTNYYCEVVVADPPTIRADCARLNLTLPNDSISRTINTCHKVIFIKPITDLETTLTANNFAEAIFLSCREHIIAGWPRKWSSENVAIVELIVDSETTFQVLENHYLHTYSLPSYFAHLFGFIHNVNGDVINEKKFEQYWKMAGDTTLEDFKLFLENCRKPSSANGITRTICTL